MLLEAGDSSVPLIDTTLAPVTRPVRCLMGCTQEKGGSPEGNRAYKERLVREEGSRGPGLR